MWERMTQLFSHKWLSTEGEAEKAPGRPSDNFLFWCQKTDALTAEQWRRGFQVLEQKVREAARQGEDMWPPSYAAFLGMCDEPEGQHKKALHQFVTPYFVANSLEDLSKKEEAQKLGEQTLDTLKTLFDD